jgi:hypothetical protein
MFSKRQENTSTPTVLPDDLLDQVAGGAKPTFYEFATPDGDIVCRPNKGNAGGKLVNTGVVCTPGGEEA